MKVRVHISYEIRHEVELTDDLDDRAGSIEAMQIAAYEFCNDSTQTDGDANVDGVTCEHDDGREIKFDIFREGRRWRLWYEIDQTEYESVSAAVLAAIAIAEKEFTK